MLRPQAYIPAEFSFLKARSKEGRLSKIGHRKATSKVGRSSNIDHCKQQAKKLDYRLQVFA